MQAVMLRGWGGDWSIDPLILHSMLDEDKWSDLRPGRLNPGEIIFVNAINPLKTKRRLLYLKTQSVPRCKHFSSRL